jgi:pimeloyl-ACP methyl ester carboxylesterase
MTMGATRASLYCIATVLAAATGNAAWAGDYVRLAGADCTTPAYLHCPDEQCSADRVINQGPVVEMKTRRTYFLDYPCDLKAGEPVTLVLSLHGRGSYGNWQRHYFPLLDYKDKYRLVIATPNSPTHQWSEDDDLYLENIVTSLVEQIGRENVRAFWLVGHSQGGLTSYRLIREAFFADRVDGILSLSGGRLGLSTVVAPDFNRPMPNMLAPTPEQQRQRQARFAEVAAMLAELPEPTFSFVFTTGEREMDSAGLPATSPWAVRLGCGARKRAADVVDTKGGYVYDASAQTNPNPAWGLLPRGGTANVFEFGGCASGRIVADVVRLDKGHTEGLEPNVTEALVKLMVAAPGGKIRNGA